MALENCILRIGKDRWKVKTAASCAAALAEITHARVTGSIGGSCLVNGKLVADVVKVNSDNTEIQAYSTTY